MNELKQLANEERELLIHIDNLSRELDSEHSHKYADEISLGLSEAYLQLEKVREEIEVVIGL